MDNSELLKRELELFRKNYQENIRNSFNRKIPEPREILAAVGKNNEKYVKDRLYEAEVISDDGRDSLIIKVDMGKTLQDILENDNNLYDKETAKSIAILLVSTPLMGGAGALTGFILGNLLGSAADSLIAGTFLSSLGIFTGVYASVVSPDLNKDKKSVIDRIGDRNITKTSIKLLELNTANEDEVVEHIVGWYIKRNAINKYSYNRASNIITLTKQL